MDDYLGPTVLFLILLLAAMAVFGTVMHLLTQAMNW